eukprot:4473665-Karenia_brevis.AAC.1
MQLEGEANLRDHVADLAAQLVEEREQHSDAQGDVSMDDFMASLQRDATTVGNVQAVKRSLCDKQDT